MALKVSNTPSNTVVKVATSYPKTTVKVVNNYGLQKGANPQPQAGAKVVQSTARPQTTAKPQTTANQQQINQIRVQQQWAQQQAEQLRLAQEKAAYERLQRKNTFDTTIATNKSDWLRKSAGVVGLGGVLDQWRSRGQAGVKYNNLGMSADDIEAAFRHFEREAEKQGNQLLNDPNLTLEKVQAYEAWLNQANSFFGKTIQNFDLANIKLSYEKDKPFTGKAAVLGRTLRDSPVGKAGTFAWNKGFEAIDLPNKLINTAINYVNPNRLRIYRDGAEIKGGIAGAGISPLQQLRNSFNAANDQRTFARSKADEQAQLDQVQRQFDARPDGRNILGTSTKSGFMRGNGFDKFRIKYGDDIVDLMADPMNWVGVGLASKGKAAIANTKSMQKVANIKNLLSKKGGKFSEKYLPTLSKAVKEYKTPGEKMFALKEMAARTKDASKAKAAQLLQNRYDISQQQNDFWRNLSMRGKYKAGRDALGEKATQLDDALRATKDPQALLSWAQQLKEKPVWYSNILQRAVKNGGQVTKRDMARIYAEVPFMRNKNLTRIGLKKDRIYGAHKAANVKKALDKDIKQMMEMGDFTYKSDAIQSERFAGKYIPAPYNGGDAPYNFRAFRRFRQPDYTPGTLSENWYDRLVMSNALPDSFARYDKIEKELASMTGRHGALNRLTKHYTDELGRTLGIDPAGLKPKKYFDKLFGKVGQNRGMMRGISRDLKRNTVDVDLPGKMITRNGHTFYREPTRLVTSEKSARAENYTRYREKFIKESKRNRKIGLPQNIWKGAVLTTNPAWYVNNAVTNEIISGLAGGTKFFKEQAKYILSKNYRMAAKDAVPKSVFSDTANGLGIGKLARLNTSIENAARVPLYLARKGWGDDAKTAAKVVDDNLFNYKMRNFERPLKAVMPFWNWSKNLSLLGIKMPVNNPRGSALLNRLNEKMTNDFNNAPGEVQEYYDESTGKWITSNKKDKLQGKLKIGDKKWLSTAWLPYTPDRAGQFGINPYIAGAGEFMSGENKFGNPTTLRKVINDRTTQTRIMENFFTKPGTARWFSKTGYGKEKQGADPAKENYSEWLDPKRNRGDLIKGLFGVPTVTKYDPDANTFRNTMSKFNKEYFSYDWDTLKRENYDNAIAKQKEVAAKYGLTWDQVQKDWGRFDTPTAKNTKLLKDDAYTAYNNYWDTWYNAKTRNPRNAVTRAYYKERSDAHNPYTMFPVLKGADKVRGTADDKLLAPSTIKDSTAVQVGGKWFKSQASADRYWNSRKNVVQIGDKFFKNAESAARWQAGVAKFQAGQAKRDFWTKYWSIDNTSERVALLNENPQYKKRDLPTTKEGWLEFKRAQKAEKMAKMRATAGFKEREMNMKTLTVPPIKFARQKKIAFKF